MTRQDMLEGIQWMIHHPWMPLAGLLLFIALIAILVRTGGAAKEWKDVSQWARDELSVLRTNPFLLIALAIVLGAKAYLAFSGLGAFSGSTGCSIGETASHPPLENWFYEHAMSAHFPVGRGRRVALVTLTEGNEPRSVIYNACENRKFLSELVPQLAVLGAAAIVLDRSYSEGSCTDAIINDSFRSALADARAPVVVGERTTPRKDNVEGGDCLVADPPFDFGTQSTGKVLRANVTRGLVQLNADIRKIPLFWWVFPSGASTEDVLLAPSKQNGLAYAAATVADRHLSEDLKLKGFFDRNEHPYARFANGLPTWSAMDVMCYSGTNLAARHPEWGDCMKNISHTPFKFAGKVVVVGVHTDSELKGIGGEKRYGMDLHAEYIEALLGHRYLRTALGWFDYGAVILLALLAIACDAMSVRKIKGKYVLNPARLAVSLASLIGFFSLGAFLILIYKDLLMPNLLLACASMIVSLLSYVIFALLTTLSEANTSAKKELL